MKTIHIVVVACLLGLALPASADGILEQMENEVAAIAQRTKNAVVTIEDSRALLVAYDTSPLEKADIANRIAHLQIDKKTQDDVLAQAEAKYRIGATPVTAVVDARTKTERLTKQLAVEQRNLEQFGRLTPLQRQRQDVSDALALLAIDKQAVETRLALFQEQYKAGAIDYAQLETSQADLAHVQQDIAAQTARGQMLDQMLRQQADANKRGANDRGDKTTDAQRVSSEVVFRFQQAEANANAPRSGTGFSIGEGYIVTTADVLDGMSNPVVITDAGAQIRARVVAVDTELNVGLIKLAAYVDLPALTLGDSSKVMPGHFAIAIGNQHGNANAVALNLIACVRTEATYSGDHFYPTLIQIGGMVGAGTSGAPLVNSHGEVIGIIAGVPQPEPEPGQYINSPANQQYGLQPASQLGLPYYLGKPSPNTQTAYAFNRALTPNDQGMLFGSGTPAVQTKPASKQSDNGQKNALKRSVVSSKAKDANVTRRMTARNPLPPGQNRAFNVPVNSVNYAAARYNTTSATGQTATDLGYTSSGNTANWAYLPVQTTPVVTSSGFAIPIGEVQAVLADMKAGRPVVHGWIGVDLENQESGTEQNGVVTVLRSVKVKGIYTGSPAQQGGVLPGDVLVTLNARALHTIGDVRAGIVKSALNQPVTLVIDRNGDKRTMNVTVEARPAQTGKVVTTLSVAPTPAKK